MWTPLTYALYALTLFSAAWVLFDLITGRSFLLKFARARHLLRLHIGTEVALVAQLVVGIAATIGGGRDIHGATFIAYLVGLVIVLPAAVWWAYGDPGRGGLAVLLVANLAIAIMVVRLTQLWAGHA
ncbi:hypothetical protein [Millisia brevis]|uniref:hypothetical protein n=1 Tax=Millisia brevis TaxID=264148 RepID=UPI00082F0255|nr:hypothetical protein [Millisia brevis]